MIDLEHIARKTMTKLWWVMRNRIETEAEILSALRTVREETLKEVVSRIQQGDEEGEFDTYNFGVEDIVTMLTTLAAKQRSEEPR